MSITPGGVHEQAALVLADGFGKGFGALLQDDLAPALSGGLGHVDLLPRLIEELGDDDLALELGLADLALYAAAVDGDIAQVRQ
jgi:hypothetical protein